MLAAGADAIVLGCTHYPFVIPAIEGIVGPRARVIDPSPAVARQVARLFSDAGPGAIRSAAGTSVDHGGTILYTSGDPVAMQKAVTKLIGMSLPVRGAAWQADGSVVKRA
jgi:glutamate racemase